MCVFCNVLRLRNLDNKHHNDTKTWDCIKKHGPDNTRLTRRENKTSFACLTNNNELTRTVYYHDNEDYVDFTERYNFNACEEQT